MTGERKFGRNGRLDGVAGSQPDGRIDAALRALGSAAPAPGLEGRILTRVAAARMQGASGVAAGYSGSPFVRAVKPLVGFVCAGALCTVIVVGSVSHSRRNQTGTAPAAPALQMPGTGVGAASAMHPGGPASAPVPAGNAGRGRSTHRASQGRARIAPHARKAPGIAVPSPASNSPQN